MTSTTSTKAASNVKLLGVGVATGSLSGLLGIGGGVVMVPALSALGFSRHRANAISLATIFLVALSGSVGFALAGSIDIPIGLSLGIGGLFGGTVGARLAHRMSGRALARIFGILLLAVGARMIVGGAPAAGVTGPDLVWGIAIAAGVGIGAGVLSGLAGVGGGVVMVPAMVFLLGLGQHVAEGTSLLAILFTAAAGTRVNHGNEYVDWRAVGLLALTGVIAAPGAALLAHQIPAESLTRIFGVWLILTGARTIWKARPAAQAAATPES